MRKNIYLMKRNILPISDFHSFPHVFKGPCSRLSKLVTLIAQFFDTNLSRLCRAAWRATTFTSGGMVGGTPDFSWRKGGGFQWFSGWWFQILFMFTPIWGRFSNLTNIFSKGLVQPPNQFYRKHDPYRFITSKLHS